MARALGQRPPRMALLKLGKLHLWAWCTQGSTSKLEKQDGRARHSQIRGHHREGREFTGTQLLQWLYYQAALDLYKRVVQRKIIPVKADRVLTLWQTPQHTVIKPHVPIILFSQRRKPRLREALTGPELYLHYIADIHPNEYWCPAWGNSLET